MDRDVEYGRRVVLVIIISSLAISVISNLFIFLTAEPGTQRIGQQLVRMSMGVALCFFLYRGANWARLLAGFIFAIACPVGVIGGLRVLRLHWITDILGAVLIAMGVVLGAFFVLLYFSPSVKAYFGAR